VCSARLDEQGFQLDGIRDGEFEAVTACDAGTNDGGDHHDLFIPHGSECQTKFLSGLELAPDDGRGSFATYVATIAGELLSGLGGRCNECLDFDPWASTAFGEARCNFWEGDREFRKLRASETTPKLGPEIPDINDDSAVNWGNGNRSTLNLSAGIVPDMPQRM